MIGPTPTNQGLKWWKFAVAALLVVIVAATATAVAGLLQVKQIAKYISARPAIKRARVVVPDPGNPQTILILGSDHRFGQPQSEAHTDTIMLVRLDGGSSTINVISVPRDLQVLIPRPHGRVVTAKINAAYSLGGPNLVVKTLEDDVFPGLQVNHIVDINFTGFIDLVNAIGCVYTQVDHRYYNNTAVTDYSSIDIQPGYQKLCGPAALAYVRFRHSDNDLVRAARQQAFVRDAKDQYGTGSLIANRDKLLKIFGEHAQTDANLHSTDGLINLFDLVAFSAGHTIKQIPFPTSNIAYKQGNAEYVTANLLAENAAFDKFMTPTTGSSAPSTSTTSTTTTTPAAPTTPARVPTAGLVPSLGAGKAQATALGYAGLSVYVPRMLAAGSAYCSGTAGNCPAQLSTVGSYPRAYTLRTRQGHTAAAYQLTAVLNPLYGQYYDIDGTTWLDPPILAGGHQVQRVGGKTLDLYFNGSKLGVVAWRTPDAVYWISNTLTSDLSKQQMIGIAASLVRVS